MLAVAKDAAGRAITSPGELHRVIAHVCGQVNGDATCVFG